MTTTQSFPPAEKARNGNISAAQILTATSVNLQKFYSYTNSIMPLLKNILQKHMHQYIPIYTDHVQPHIMPRKCIT